MTESKNNSYALYFVILTVLIDMIGLGIVLPVLPSVIEEVAYVDIGHAATIGGWLYVAYSAMQFLFGPVIGNLSDTLGRRPILLLSLGGLGIDYIFTAFAPNIGWLFAGRLIAGICGASYATTNAFIADVTEPEKRGNAFGLVGAVFGIGFIVGPALGGVCAHFGTRVPFFAAAALSIANVIYGYLVLPETLAIAKRRPFSIARANPLGGLMALRRHPMLLRAGATLFLHFLAKNVYPAIWAYYTIYRYGWGALAIGLSLATFGVVSAITQGALVGPFIQSLGERRAAIVCLTIECIAGVGFALATPGWMIYALLPLTAISGMATPAINAMMTRQVEENAQGELQGAISSIMGIALIISPAAAAQIFGAFAGGSAAIELPGAPFFVSALLSATALWAFTRSPKKEA